MEENKYMAQKKYLSENRKQLRVWVETEKYNIFKSLVEKNETSIYKVINDFITEYINKN